jgi:microcystin-dependent protein
MMTDTDSLGSITPVSGGGALGNGDHYHAVALSTTGGGGAHQNLQPYLVVNYIMRVA